MTVRVWAAASGVTAEDVRLATQAAYVPAGAGRARTGILPNGADPGALTGTGALTASVSPLQALVAGTSSDLQGGYLVTVDAASPVTFDPGDGANPRIDLVVLRVRDDDYDSSGSQSGAVEVVPGTPAGTPAAPAVPDSSLALWQVLVPAAASGGSPIAFTTAKTDRRVYTGTLGAPFPVRNATERNAIVAPYAGMAIWRADLRWVERFDGAAWRVDGVPTAATLSALTAAVTSPRDGQIGVTTGDGRTFQYSATLPGWKADDSGWTALDILSPIGTHIGSDSPSVRKVGPMAYLRGRIERSGTFATNTIYEVLDTALPVALRPAVAKYFAVGAHHASATSRLIVNPNGTVQLTTNNDLAPLYVDLSSASWFTA